MKIRDRRVAFLVALLAPLAVTIVYLVLSRWPDRWFTGASDWIAVGVAILCGLVGLWSLPVRRWHKAVATLLYVPTMALLLEIAALLFVCGVFGACL